jgi:uncharacterized protein (DUF885 family)
MMANVATLIADYVAETCQFDPVSASRAGLVAFDAELGDPSGERAQQSLTERERIANQLTGIDPSPLTADERLDRAFALALIAADRVRLSQRPWATRPDQAVSHAIDGLYQLALRPSLDGVDRRPSLVARLSAYPSFIRAASRALTADASRHACNLALRGIGGSRDFLKSLAGETTRNDPQLGDEVSRKVDDSLAALDEYEAKTKATLDRCTGDFAIGQVDYDRLLSDYQIAPYDHETLLAMGDDMVRTFQRDLETVARQIDPDRSVPEIVRSLKNDFPDADRVIPEYREEIDRSRRFVVEHDLVTIPDFPEERFEVSETPMFMRSTIPFGFVSMSPVFSPNGRSVWHITIPRPEDDDARRRQTLQGHNRWNTWAITFHEGYPGHHLHSLHLKRVPGDLRRKFGVSIFSEGWGLYTEDLMEEYGYFTDPRAKFMQVLNSLWRAVRVVVDSGLHTRGMSIEEAAGMLVDVSYLEPNNALVEASRYAITPTYAASYLMGKLLIKDIRQKYSERFPDDDAKSFHDRLLSYGAIPPAIVEAELFGA